MTEKQLNQVQKVLGRVLTEGEKPFVFHALSFGDSPELAAHMVQHALHGVKNVRPRSKAWYIVPAVSLLGLGGYTIYKRSKKRIKKRMKR